MGWDAFAVSKEGNEAEFKQAAQSVAKLAGSVDGFLAGGGLDCTACAYALQNATGESCWDGAEWSAEQVQLLAAQANWPKSPVNSEKVAVYSAKAFLDTCSKIGAGIRFSF